MTIDELARRTGTTSRNIRAYQERGLLPSPRLVGRVGHYGEGHVARLRHIADLLARGFTLASIRELFEAWENGYGLAGVLGFEEALAAPWAERNGSTRLSRVELEETFGADTPSLAQAVRLGILVAEDGDTYRAPNPQLLDAARTLVDAGVPLTGLLEEARRLVDDLDRVAERWVALFQEHVWRDYVRRGMPPEELEGITAFLQQLRPMLGGVVGSLLAHAMERKVAATAADTFGAPPPKRRRRRSAS
jgi:DNA-binding transcriptional MerR regulator